MLGHRCLGMRLLLHHHGVLRLSMMLHMMRMRMLLLWVCICGGGLQQRWRTAVATTNSRPLGASVSPATAASTTMCAWAAALVFTPSETSVLPARGRHGCAAVGLL